MNPTTDYVLASPRAWPSERLLVLGHGRSWAESNGGGERGPLPGAGGRVGAVGPRSQELLVLSPTSLQRGLSAKQTNELQVIQLRS